MTKPTKNTPKVDDDSRENNEQQSKKMTKMTKKTTKDDDDNKEKDEQQFPN